ncbi:MAG TPA: MFS transporter [Candidatus Sulfotelmatobacter sp.]|nr:MFS transporter [Candidatus Sulfotelmatobacter sp.]
MLSSETPQNTDSAKILTIAAHAAFVPIGVVTVLLSPLLPTLSARWSLNYSQAGALFPAQYLASTLAVALSGILVARSGFRVAIQIGLLIIAVSLTVLMGGSRLLGIICIVGYGAGLGLAVPAANLLVAEVNPNRRSAAVSLLNFSWSTGAVSCPFLVAAAASSHRVPTLLAIVAGFSVLVVVGIAAIPAAVREPSVSGMAAGKSWGIDWHHPALIPLVALFFFYVGTENSFGGWIATYASSLGNITPAWAAISSSFFYAALMLGRWIAPLLLRRVEELRLAQGGILLACAGMAGLVMSNTLIGVAVSASTAGLGLAGVYPIAISLLSREFGAAASRVGSLTFTMANVGGACLPWLVGVVSTRSGTLRAGLSVPVIGAVTLLVLFSRRWSPFTEQSR